MNKQIRYYYDNSIDNYPNELISESLHNGNAFINITPVTELNIQSMPGTKFYINGNYIPCIIDNSWNFTINNLIIKSLLFDEESLNKIVDNHSYLIINYK